MRSGYINPVLLAKMISTFDQFSGGRIYVNLTAGQAEAEAQAEGIRYVKEDRYALMEEVRILKALWSAKEPFTFKGRFHQIDGASILPSPRPSPHSKFYLDGGSEEAWALSAKHSDVHLFWGDTTERIEEDIVAIRVRAAEHGLEAKIGFGMRLQVICRRTEAKALEAAERLIRNIPEAARELLKRDTFNSKANKNVQQLVEEKGLWIAPHLWSGLTRSRRGAGTAVVGDPQQCATTLQCYINAGCHSFYLSGYLHDAEAERFRRLARPILEAQNPGRFEV